MNVLEGLQTIRRRLEDNDAQFESVAVVDAIIKRASLPAAKGGNAQSLLQLVRMLMRTPQAASNNRVYNDFVRLEEEIESASNAFREKQAAEDAKPVPKTKKFYKDLKEHEKKTGTAR